MHGLYTLLVNKYYVDEIYAAAIVRPLLWISTNVLWHVVDERIIDGVVNGTASTLRESGSHLRELQSGNARSYASWVYRWARLVSRFCCSDFWEWCASVDKQPLLLTVITFLPLLSVAALLLLRSDDHIWIRRIALAASVAEFAVSLFLLRGFDATSSQFQFEEFHDWIGSAIHYHLGVDGISLFLVLLTTFLTPFAILCSWQSIHENVKGFFIAILVIETAMIGVFVSLDLFLFFVFWELTLIPMYFLIGIWGHERRVYAAIKFILYTMFGSILMLVAILWLYNLAGTFDFAGYSGMEGIQQKLMSGAISLPPHTELLLFGAFFLAFCHLQKFRCSATAHLAAGRPHRKLPQPVP